MTSELELCGNVGFTSPYVLSVFVALEEKGLAYDLRLIDLESGGHHDPGYVAESISNRVPALRHGDFWIAESSAITEYLEEAFPPPDYSRIYPADSRDRARVRMVQALIRSDFLPIREERSTATVFQGEAARPLSPAAAKSVDRLLRIAASLVDGPRYLVGDFTVADVDLSMMLQRLVANDDPVPVPLRDYANFVWTRPSIRAWLARTKYDR